LATEFVEYILQRAREDGGEVCRRVEVMVEEGRARGSLTLKDTERSVGGRFVRVVGGGAEVVESWNGRRLLRLRIAAEVDGVWCGYVITFGRYGRNNAAAGFAAARANAPGGRETDAERFSVPVETLTGKRPRIYRKSDGEIMMVCYEGHLEGFMRYAELADVIEGWLEETGWPRAPPPSALAGPG
jgi:hypothetical protein